MEFLLEFLIFTPCFTGALIIWCMNGFSGSFKDVARAHQDRSFVIGLSFWVTIGIVVGYFVKNGT
jgi:hypothetical protein